MAIVPAETGFSGWVHDQISLLNNCIAAACWQGLTKLQRCFKEGDFTPHILQRGTAATE
jgi:hypothetical protein